MPDRPEPDPALAQGPGAEARSSGCATRRTASRSRGTAQRRGKRMRETSLTDIPGVGPTRAPLAPAPVRLGHRARGGRPRGDRGRGRPVDGARRRGLSRARGGRGAHERHVRDRGRHPGRRISSPPSSRSGASARAASLRSPRSGATAGFELADGEVVARLLLGAAVRDAPRSWCARASSTPRRSSGSPSPEGGDRALRRSAGGHPDAARVALGREDPGDRGPLGPADLARRASTGSIPVDAGRGAGEFTPADPAARSSSSSCARATAASSLHHLGGVDVPLARADDFDDEFATFGLTADAESVVRLIDGKSTRGRDRERGAGGGVRRGEAARRARDARPRAPGVRSGRRRRPAAAPAEERGEARAGRSALPRDGATDEPAAGGARRRAGARGAAAAEPRELAPERASYLDSAAEPGRGAAKSRSPSSATRRSKSRGRRPRDDGRRARRRRHRGGLRDAASGRRGGGPGPLRRPRPGPGAVRSAVRASARLDHRRGLARAPASALGLAASLDSRNPRPPRGRPGLVPQPRRRRSRRVRRGRDLGDRHRRRRGVRADREPALRRVPTSAAPRRPRRRPPRRPCRPRPRADADAARADKPRPRAQSDPGAGRRGGAPSGGLPRRRAPAPVLAGPRRARPESGSRGSKKTRYAIQLELACEVPSLVDAWQHDRRRHHVAPDDALRGQDLLPGSLGPLPDARRRPRAPSPRAPAFFSTPQQPPGRRRRSAEAAFLLP